MDTRNPLHQLINGDGTVRPGEASGPGERWTLSREASATINRIAEQNRRRREGLCPSCGQPLLPKEEHCPACPFVLPYFPRGEYEK